MVQYRHNEPYYKLQLSELDEDAVRVLAFEGKEQVSRLFHYQLELLSEDAELDPAAILNKKATLLFSRGDEDPLPVHGIISHFEQRGRTPDYVSYYAELVPKMWRLELNFQSRVFQNMNIEQMIAEVLETAEFAGEDFEFKLNETYPDIEFAVQYRETDFNYVNRRLEHYGIYYYFEHRDDNDVIVFSDVNDNLPTIETEDDISYNPNKDPLSEKETISRFTYQGQVVTGKTQLKDYNYETPSKELLAESQINSDNPGIHSDYGDHFKDESEGEFQARIRDEEIVSRGTIYKGNGDCRPFHAGYKFTMNEHYREDWNQEFLLTKVLSRGNQRSLFGTFPPGTKVPPTYENYFESMPEDIPFRPQCLSMQPKITGVLNAKVDSAGDGSQAEVDDQGRYKVILPFDLSGNSGGEASCSIRMIQPYAGPNFGMHFPLHKDTEVLLTFIDGNPDFPVISGAVPNPETISPVTNANQTKSVIRDNFGNEIVMDATSGNEHIRMYSPHHKSGFELGRSLVNWSASNKSELTLGNKMDALFGTKLDFTMGNIAEFKLGTMWNGQVGLEYSASYGGKFELNNSFEVKSNRDSIVHISQKDVLARGESDHIIAAGDQVCIVGGSKASPKEDMRSIANIFPELISLSVGSKNTTFRLDSDRKFRANAQGGEIYNQTPSTVMWATSLSASLFFSIVTLIAGEIPTMVDYQSSASEDALEYKGWEESIGIASFIITLIQMSILRHLLKKEIGEDKIEPVSHKYPHAKIQLKKGGIIDVFSNKRQTLAVGGVLGWERRDKNDKEGPDLYLKHGSKINIDHDTIELVHSKKFSDADDNPATGENNTSIKLGIDGIQLQSGAAKSLFQVKHNGHISAGGEEITLLAQGNIKLQSKKNKPVLLNGNKFTAKGCRIDFGNLTVNP